jgi:c-di-AMP phosphodiesterase-like protein
MAWGLHSLYLQLCVCCAGKSRIDVGRICSSFGGGGHYSAASATILDLTLEEVLQHGQRHFCAWGAL